MKPETRPTTHDPWCVAIGACEPDEHGDFHSPCSSPIASALHGKLHQHDVWVWPSARNMQAWRES